MCSFFSFFYFQRLFSGENLGHPYGLAHHDNFIFWTEYQHGSVQRLNLTDKSVTRLIKENPPLFQIRIFDVSAQTGILFVIFKIFYFKLKNIIISNYHI